MSRDLTMKRLMEKHLWIKEFCLRNKKFFLLFAKGASQGPPLEVKEVFTKAIREGRPFTQNEKDFMRSVYRTILEEESEKELRDETTLISRPPEDCGVGYR